MVTVRSLLYYSTYYDGENIRDVEDPQTSTRPTPPKKRDSKRGGIQYCGKSGKIDIDQSVRETFGKDAIGVRQERYRTGIDKRV